MLASPVLGSWDGRAGASGERGQANGVKASNSTGPQARGLQTDKRRRAGRPVVGDEGTIEAAPASRETWDPGSRISRREDIDRSIHPPGKPGPAATDQSSSPRRRKSVPVLYYQYLYWEEGRKEVAIPSAG